MYDLGPWLLGARLGRGAAGEVWSAQNVDRGIDAALKVFLGPSDEAVRASETELRAVAALDHPAILRVLHHGRVQPSDRAARDGRCVIGAPWIATELARGGPLSMRLPLASWDEVTVVLRRLLSALAHAHAHDLVHRDVKPENLLLRAETGELESACLADFDIASSARDAGDRRGTPWYAAPEQIRGSPVRPATDLYAVGVVAWQLLTGAPPFAGGSASEIVRAHLEAELPPFRPRFAVPSAVAEWLARLLQRDPRARPQVAADALHALTQLGAPDDPTAIAAAPAFRAATLTWLPEIEAPIDPAPSETPLPPSGPPPLPADWRRERGTLDLQRRPDALFGLAPTPFVGRTGERDAAWEALRSVSEGGGPITLLIEGASGSGTSRLGRWLAERAAECGVAVLRAGHPVPESAPEALAWTIRGAVGLPEHASRREIVERAGPWLGPRLAGWLGPGAPALPGWDQLARAWDVVTELADGRVLLLWIDDAQWAGPLLDLAVHAVAHHPRVLVVCSIRVDVEPLRAATRALGRLAARTRTVRLALGPLTRPECIALLRDHLGLPEAFAVWAAVRSAGDPTLALHLVETAVAAGLFDQGEPDAATLDALEVPSAVEQVRQGRLASVLARLDADRVAALEVGAVLGQVVDERAWRRVCDHLGLRGADDALAALLDAGIARPHGLGRWAFAGTTARRALLDHARDDGRDSRWHAACVDLLGATLPPLDRALHLIAAGRSVEGLDALLQLGWQGEADRVGLRVEVLGVAAEVLRELGVPETDPRAMRYDLLAAITDVWSHRPDRALPVLRRIAWMAHERGMVAEASRALWSLGDIALRHGDMALGEARYLEALAIDPNRRRTVSRPLAELYIATGRAAEADALLEAVLREEPADDWTRAQLMVGRGHAALALGHLDEARRHLEAALAAFQAEAALDGMGQALNLLGDVHRMAGRLEEAEDAYRGASEHLALSNVGGTAIAGANLGLVLLQRNRGGEAAERFRTAIIDLESQGWHAMTGPVRVGLAAALALQGALDDAERALADGWRAIEAAGVADPDAASALLVLARAARDRNRLALSRRAASLALGVFERLGRAEADEARLLAT